MKKLFALLLVCATLLAMPFGTFAMGSGSREVEARTWTSPLVNVTVPKEYLPSGREDHTTASGTFSSVEEAAVFMRSEMKKRTTDISVTVNNLQISDEPTFWSSFEALLDQVYAYTGKAKEGDYIRWNIGWYRWGGSLGGSSTTFRISDVIYMATAAQEKVVDTDVNKLIEELNLPRANDYLTLKALYDWVTANITYDYTHLNSSDPNDPENYYWLMHSAYAAIVDRTCVCQGYTNLLYRVGLQVGLEGRMCDSDAQNHIWNIFKMVDLYYECDSTWDAGESPSNYTYFLRGRTNWLKVHNYNAGDATVGDQYAEFENFDKEYPLSDDDFSYTKHTLTIKPVDVDGNALGHNVTYSYMPFKEFSLTPPAITGFTPVKTTVKGTMPGHDKTVKVKYELGINVKASLVETGVKINWSLADSVSKYSVYRKTGSGSWKTLTTSAGKSFVDKTVKVSTKYKYKIVTGHGESKIVTITTGRFLDVLPSMSCYKAVDWAAENGIVGGTSDTTFSPSADCNRAQFALMLYRLAGKPEVDLSKNPFKDLPSSTGIQKAIVWAYTQGIVNGTSSTTYSPSDNITRAQLILMMYKMAGKPDVTGLTCPFKDLKGLTANTKKAIIWAYNNGIVSGTSATTFGPKNNCTRGQLAIILFRYNKLFNFV